MCVGEVRSWSEERKIEVKKEKKENKNDKDQTKSVF